MKRKKWGDTYRKHSCFSQKLLTQDEFRAFCKGVRALPTFRSYGSDPLAEHSGNRMIVPVADLHRHPPLPESCHQAPGERSDSFESSSWRDQGRSLDLINGFLRSHVKELSCCINIGGLLTELRFRWSADGSDPADGFSIRWFIGGIGLNDRFSEGIISDKLVGSSGMNISPDYRRWREAQVRSTLGFLDGIRLKPDFTQLKGSIRSSAIWQRLLEWRNGEGAGIPMDIRLIASVPYSREKPWDPRDIQRLLQECGCESVCNLISLRESYRTDDRNLDARFHEWLAGLIGLGTLSGCAARFELGRLGKDGVIVSHLIPRGAVISYERSSTAAKQPPGELAALLEGSGWTTGQPPGGGSFRHPVYGKDEYGEPLPSSDVERQIKAVIKDFRMWKPPVHSIPPPGSLEEQIENLRKHGAKLPLRWEIEDFLESHPRERYETEPYTRALIHMGNDGIGATYWGRLWYVDPGEHQGGGHERCIRKLNAMIEWGFKLIGIKVSPGSTGTGSSQIEFHAGGEHCVWEIEPHSGWFEPDIVVEFDRLLKDHHAGVRVFALRDGEEKYLFAVLKQTEVDLLNEILPIPFKLFVSH